MFYIIEDTLKESNAKEFKKSGRPYVAVLKTQEWQNMRDSFEMGIDMDIYDEVQNTKVDVNFDSLTGTFSIPDRRDVTGDDFKFAFALDEKGIVFIDDSGTAQKYIDSIRQSKKWRMPGLERFIYDFLEQIISGDMDSTGNTGASQFSTMFSTDLVGELMNFLGVYGMSERMTNFITTVADNIFGIVWSSGIQILLFLAALQNIPPSAKEAAQMEGATSWEYFWKITFPYVSPFILANLIFTVIDSFTNPMNKVMKRIMVFQSEDLNYGLASAMTWIYFVIVLISIGLISAIVNRFIYYEID